MNLPRSHTSRFSVPLVFIATALMLGAQEMNHSHTSKPSVQLVVTGLDGKAVTLTPQDLAALPHKTISAFNSHTKANETYAGVALSEVLAKVGTPQGEAMKGHAFMTAVIAQGTDDYSVVYALAETDPSIHTGDVLVADALNGQKLSEDGAFKMVSTDEKRPARWVRNLTSITVVEVKH